MARSLRITQIVTAAVTSANGVVGQRNSVAVEASEIAPFGR